MNLTNIAGVRFKGNGPKVVPIDLNLSVGLVLKYDKVTAINTDQDGVTTLIDLKKVIEGILITDTTLQHEMDAPLGDFIQEHTNHPLVLADYDLSTLDYVPHIYLDTIKERVIKSHPLPPTPPLTNNRQHATIVPVGEASPLLGKEKDFIYLVNGLMHKSIPLIYDRENGYLVEDFISSSGEYTPNDSTAKVSRLVYKGYGEVKELTLSSSNCSSVSIVNDELTINLTIPDSGVDLTQRRVHISLCGIELLDDYIHVLTSTMVAIKMNIWGISKQSLANILLSANAGLDLAGLDDTQYRIDIDKLYDETYIKSLFDISQTFLYHMDIPDYEISKATVSLKGMSDNDIYSILQSLDASDSSVQLVLRNLPNNAIVPHTFFYGFGIQYNTKNINRYIALINNDVVLADLMDLPDDIGIQFTD